MKQCAQCNEWKDISSYKRTGSNASPMRYCRECYVERRRHNKQSGQKYCQRSAGLKDSYGITLEDYDTMLQNQNNRCAICHGENPKGAKRANVFVVDHDHKTGVVRGLLCHACNRAIGNLGDNVENFYRAIEYLSKVR